jgi:hypothetical protein
MTERQRICSTGTINEHRTKRKTVKWRPTRLPNEEGSAWLAMSFATLNMEYLHDQVEKTRKRKCGKR